MRFTIADLKKGEKGIITDSSSENIPLKLLEMGCLPGNEVELLHLAPFNDPLYLIVDGTHIAIRKDLACQIFIDSIKEYG